LRGDEDLVNKKCLIALYILAIYLF